MCRVCALVVAFSEGNIFSKGPNFQTVPIFAFMSFFQIPQKLGLLPAELPPAQLVGDLHSIGRRPRPNDHT